MTSNSRCGWWSTYHFFKKLLFSYCMQFITHIIIAVPFLLLFLWSLSLALTSSFQLCKSCPSFKTWRPESHYRAFLSCALSLTLLSILTPLLPYIHMSSFYTWDHVLKVIHFSTLEEALPADINYHYSLPGNPQVVVSFFLFFFSLGFTPNDYMYLSIINIAFRYIWVSRNY